MKTIEMSDINSRSQSDTTTTLSQPKLVAIEISNSQNKRFDGNGQPLIVQSVWKDKIPLISKGKGSETSPQVMIGHNQYWFGEMAANGDHISVANTAQDKSCHVRLLLSSLLLPSDRVIRLVMSYHSPFDTAAVNRIKQDCLGVHSFIRNGKDVRVTVADVEVVPEGIGALWLARENGVPSVNTLAVELGFRTGEPWIVNAEGQIIGGQPLEDLGIYNLCRDIAQDDSVRAVILGTITSSRQVNPSQIAIALRTGTLSKMHPERWQVIANSYIKRWADKALGRLLTDYAEELNNIEQLIFSGGGAMLARERFLKAGIHVDERADTASVRGMYCRAKAGLSLDA